MKKTLCGLVGLTLISCAPVGMPKNILMYEKQVIEKKLYEDGTIDYKSSVYQYQRPKRKDL